MLTTSFTNGLYKFTDGEFISPSVPMDNLYLPMVNWLTIGTGEHSLFTDGIFIFQSVRMDTDGRNNFTKLTVGMLATILDNPLMNARLTPFRLIVDSKSSTFGNNDLAFVRKRTIFDRCSQVFHRLISYSIRGA
jgi:hypothetical protein